MIAENIIDESERRVCCAEGRMPSWACRLQTLCPGVTENGGQERGVTGGVPAALCLSSAVLLRSGLVKAK